jgi:hypothetical protein
MATSEIVHPCIQNWHVYLSRPRMPGGISSRYLYLHHDAIKERGERWPHSYRCSIFVDRSRVESSGGPFGPCSYGGRRVGNHFSCGVGLGRQMGEEAQPSDF